MEDYRNNPEFRKLIEQKTAERIIRAYLAIKKKKDEPNNEEAQEIFNKYKNNVLKYEKLYDFLDPDLRKRCEEEIRKEIEDGKFDLDKHIEELYEDFKPQDDREER